MNGIFEFNMLHVGQFKSNIFLYNFPYIALNVQVTSFDAWTNYWVPETLPKVVMLSRTLVA